MNKIKVYIFLIWKIKLKYRHLYSILRTDAFSVSLTLTHEIEIAFSTKPVSNEPNHLVKLYSSINNWSERSQNTHVRVHLGIHQPKC